MRDNRLRKQSGEKAQAMVEFALVSGILFLLLFAIVDFSRLIFNYATLSNGVREGARYAVVHPAAAYEADIIARAEQMIVLIGSTATVTVSSPGWDDGEDPDEPYCSHLCPVIVTATSNFDAWTPVIPAFQLEAKATMHYE
jgi:hypothetical protein